MAAKRPQRPQVRDQAVIAQVGTPESTERAVGEIARVIDVIRERRRSRHTVDLVVGDNRIAHGLGRKAEGATVTPTVADASFAWSFAVDGDKIAIITVIGVAQPNAFVEVM